MKCKQKQIIKKIQVGNIVFMEKYTSDEFSLGHEIRIQQTLHAYIQQKMKYEQKKTHWT